MSTGTARPPAQGGTSAWRRWNRAAHRDLGYLCLGLTLAYAVSGVALNHIQDWNPNYRLERRTLTFSPTRSDDLDLLVREALTAAGETGPVTSIFEPAPGQVHIFAEGNTLRVDYRRGVIDQERAVERPVLYPLNSLHLNRLKGAWTWLADLYAGALAVLAISGILIPRGRTGLRRRGAWLSALGVLIPVAFLLLDP